jgi:hypothetical protein
MLVLSYRRMELKKGRKLDLEELETRKGYRNGVNVPCKVGHLGGIFLHRVEEGVVLNYFSTKLDIDLIGLSLGPS